MQLKIYIYILLIQNIDLITLSTKMLHGYENSDIYLKTNLCKF